MVLIHPLVEICLGMVVNRVGQLHIDSPTDGFTTAELDLLSHTVLRGTITTRTRFLQPTEQSSCQCEL